MDAPISGSADAATSYTVSGLTAGMPYSFKVRAFVGTGGARVDGVKSDAQSVTPTN